MPYDVSFPCLACTMVNISRSQKRAKKLSVVDRRTVGYLKIVGRSVREKGSALAGECLGRAERTGGVKRARGRWR